MLFACLLYLAIAIPAFAVNAEVYADTVHASGDTVTVPLNIYGNPGLMGFKLIVHYDSSILQPKTVTRGRVTQNGLLNDSIGAGEAGILLIVWSDTDAAKSDGTLAVLTFKAIQQTDTTLTVAYSQPDTFDGGFTDVVLDCKPVEIVYDGETQTTPRETKIPDSRDILAAVDSVEDKTNVSAVNDAIVRLAGTENMYNAPEEIQSAYSEAVADTFVETALLAVNGEKIGAAIQNALQEVGAETTRDIPSDKQDAFVKAVETALQTEASDVPTISDAMTAEEAIQAIEDLQQQNAKAEAEGVLVPDLEKKRNRIGVTITCVAGAVVLIIVVVLLILKHKAKVKEEGITE